MKHSDCKIRDEGSSLGSNGLHAIESCDGLDTVEAESRVVSKGVPPIGYGGVVFIEGRGKIESRCACCMGQN